MGLEYLNFRHSHGVHPNILSGNMILQTLNRQRKYRVFRRDADTNGKYKPAGCPAGCQRRDAGYGMGCFLNFPASSEGIRDDLRVSLMRSEAQ